jgi:hypothetical protein
MIDPIELIDFELGFDGPAAPCPSCGRSMAPMAPEIEGFADIIPHCDMCGVVLAA